MGLSKGRKITACAVVSLSVAAGGITAAVAGSANAAENDSHPLAVQRVWNAKRDGLVRSIFVHDISHAGTPWCINLDGPEGSWTDADPSVKVLEGHTYGIIGYDTVNCPETPGDASRNATVPVGMTTHKYWMIPNFAR
jgi:hypothetical protein